MSINAIDLYKEVQDILDGRTLPRSLDADFRKYGKSFLMAKTTTDTEDIMEEVVKKRLRQRLWDATNYDIVKKYDALIKELMS